MPKDLKEWENDAKQTPRIDLVLKKCWKPDCKKIAICRDGSGWEWCFQHIDQEKIENSLHSPAEWYDLAFYKSRISSLLSFQAREIIEKMRLLSDSYRNENANDMLFALISKIKEKYL